MDKTRLIEEYSSYVERGCAALFVGAGISQQAGYPSWKQLLSDVAAQLGLDIEQEYDLAGVAQYYLNRSHANRTKIADIIKKEFPPKKDVPDPLRILARMPIRSIWTMNYDTLIEKAWELQNKHLDVKSRNDDLLTGDPWAHAVLYKMHGTVEHPTEVVLARNDYELYRRERAGFYQMLISDLISKRFLFVGFSFTDPNLFYVFGLIREAYPKDAYPAGHFAIVRRPSKEGTGTKAENKYQYALKRHDLWVQDLERYGITAVEINDFNEIKEILATLERQAARRSVFVSGSYPESLYTKERQKIEEVSRRVGRLLGQKELRLVSGFGLTVGSAVLSGLLEELYKLSAPSLEKALLLRPFPQTIPTGFKRKDFNRRYREDLLAQAGVCIYIGGLKNSKGTTVVADGVLDEFSIATALNRLPIPIGATGGAAAEIWKKVSADYKSFYGSMERRVFDRLNSDALSPAQLVECVETILKWADSNS
jgi:hypothetical protein